MANLKGGASAPLRPKQPAVKKSVSVELYGPPSYELLCELVDHELNKRRP